MLLRSCTQLNDLTIGSKKNMDCNFVEMCAEDPRCELALSKIHRLSVYVKFGFDTCSADVRAFILSLPNLRSLNTDATRVIWAYLRKYNGGILKVFLNSIEMRFAS